MVLDISKQDKKKLIEIGEKVRKLRKEKTKNNLKEMAKILSMDKKTYYRIERGEGDYYITNLLKIAFYHEISLAELFEGL